MRSQKTRFVSILLALIISGFGFMMIAHGIQTDHGNVSISEGILPAEEGNLTYKLYVPDSASEDTKAPGVLLLHGYQNDRETNAAYAIELSRRGIVVLSLDEYGHGKTSIGLLNRGTVNHRVTVNFGEESEEEGTYTSVGGPERFRLMMNFSNLSFFDDYYSRDDEGGAITDSSCGGIDAYAFLSELPFVDTSRLGISGHSMGTWSGWTVAAAYAGKTNSRNEDITPKATVLQCGELFRDSVYDTDTIFFNNVLLLQAKYDEFSYFRDYQSFLTEEVLQSPLRTEFLGCSPGEAAWDTTFGSFADGTARRMELLETNHRLTTHDKNGLAVSLDWFGSAFDWNMQPTPTDQRSMTKEWLVFFATLSAVAAMVPLTELLLKIPFFAALGQPLPSRETILSRKKWWKNAVITMLLAGITYPFMTQLGHGLFPFPETIFRMTIGNGFLCWYLLLIVIMLITSFFSFRKAKKDNRPVWNEMGFAEPDNSDHLSLTLLVRGLVLSLSLLAMLYLLVWTYENLFLLDLRFIWPFFKTFSVARFGQFLVYFPFFALFFLLNNSKIFAGMRTEATYKEGAAGFFSCWVRSALLMVGGVLVIVLIEYIPFFLGIGPGADLLFSSLFGGPFMSILIVFVPQVLVFSLLCTYFYRRTGSVYTGAFTVAAMAAWIITGGSAML